MFLPLHKRSKYILGLLIALLFTFQPAWAGGPPEPSVFSNPLALILMILMIILLIVIAILANILIGAADVKLKKRKESKNLITGIILFLLLMPGSSLFAQTVPATTTTAAKTIGDMPAATFYLMATVIFLELLVIIVMLINIKLLLKAEKEKLLVAEAAPEAVIAKVPKLSWWDRMNKLRPVSQEAELDLGHEYDGIRELNNKLPPWWIYGFYLTILFAAVYLWRFHVSHNGPSSKQEYETSVTKAALKTEAYLKAKGDLVDENTVTLLTGANDLAEGKAIYMKSCVACHTETGAGNIGPNLTDDFWIHGNDIKSIFKTIRYGINAMPQWQNAYSNKEMAQVASYIKTLRGTNPPNPKAPQGIEMKEDSAPASPATDSTKTK